MPNRTPRGAEKTRRLLQWVRLAFECVLFPQSCCLCGAWTPHPDWYPLCDRCRRTLRPLSGPTCCYCGVPVPANLLDEGYPCKRCRTSAFAFERARSWGLYQGALRDVIRCFKFDRLPRLSGPLGELLVEAFQEHFAGDGIEQIVPIPPSRERLRERGFDQTILLARSLSRQTGIPIFRKLLRDRHTAPQVGLNLRQRKKNLHNAFLLQKGHALRGSILLLLDDVMTTGVTAHEASRLLLRQGEAAKVVVLTVARVGKHLA